MSFLSKIKAIFSAPEMSESERATRDLALQPQLQEIIKYVGSVPEGRDLLALAKEWDCPIRYDSRLRKRGMAAVFEVSPDGKEFTIAVDPSFSVPLQVSYLCHELRHLQQYAELEDFEKFTSLTPPLQRIALRFQEADAHVFQMHMAKKIGQATGLKIPFRSGSGEPLPFPATGNKADGRKADENKSALRVILRLVVNAPKVVKLILHAAAYKFPIGHYNPFERFREGVNPEALFRVFQHGLAGHIYDKRHDERFDQVVKTLPQGTLSAAFNEKSFKGIVDFKKMCRLGVDENAPSYLEGTEIENIKFVGRCIGRDKFKKDASYLKA